MLLTDEIKKERLKRAYSGFRNVPEKLHRATQALFWEHRHACRWKEKNFHPPYNLSMRDHDDTLSMPQIYFQCASEYEAALVLLGNWEHWEKLCATKWFPKYLEKWRNEKDRREQAIGRGKIIELANSGNLAAAKYLDQLHKQPKAVKESPVEEVPKQEEQAHEEESNDSWALQQLKRLGN